MFGRTKMLNVEQALVELEQKDYRTIQEETAWKWASRACACYQNCVSSEISGRLECWTLAEEYYHEAIEHAALVEGQPYLVQEVRDAIAPYQEKAATAMSPEQEKESDVV